MQINQKLMIRGYQSLLIDLFSDSNIIGSINRVTRQIETRPFQFSDSIDFGEANASQERIGRLIGYYYQMSGTPRSYSRLDDGDDNKSSNISLDNMFIFEACGLEKGSADNTVVLDFSESLDYVLHILSNCDMENIRKLDNYNTVSRAIMNMDFDKLATVSLGSLMSLDEKLKKYCMGILRKATAEESNEDIILKKLLFTFFKDILSMTALIRDYCALTLRNDTERRYIYRSKSYAAAVLACNTVIDEDLLLKSDRYGEYSMHIKSYKKFEYLEKGGVCI